MKYRPAYRPLTKAEERHAALEAYEVALEARPPKSRARKRRRLRPQGDEMKRERRRRDD